MEWRKVTMTRRQANKAKSILDDLVPPPVVPWLDPSCGQVDSALIIVRRTSQRTTAVALRRWTPRKQGNSSKPFPLMCALYCILHFVLINRCSYLFLILNDAVNPLCANIRIYSCLYSWATQR